MEKGLVKIEIKESNKCLSTEYFGGKVTNKCIEKCLGSPNETTRKRSQFSKNAKSWNK